MEKIKLDPETSALILIDLQHGIVARAVAAKAVFHPFAFRLKVGTALASAVLLASPTAKPDWLDTTNVPYHGMVDCSWSVDDRAGL